MHFRLLSLIFLLLHFILLFVVVHSHPRPHPFAPSNPLFSLFPSSKPTLRSFRNLLTYYCRDAQLISHNPFTLNQRNLLTLPPTHYQFLQSLHLQSPSLQKLPIHPCHLLRQSESNPPSEPPSDYRNFYTTYHTFNDLQKRWDHLARRYPSVRTTHIGFSIQSRPIVLLTIGTTDPDNPKRIFLNALQHAREWITAPAATYIAEKLALNTLPDAAEADTDVRNLLRSVQVLIVPVVNPDGYVYSHTEEGETRPRLWRKNRRPLSGTCSPGSDDFDVEYAPGGVDLNRNWATDFGGPHFASSSECDLSYKGAKPFSEPETRAVSQFMKQTKGILAHIDFHSYGQVILGPWASSEERPARACEYDSVGKEMAKRMIASSGTKYNYGRGLQFENGAYAASGAMTDWVHEEFSQSLSYTVELQPDASFLGDQGFELAPEQIIPTSKEAFAAVKMLLQYSNDTDGFLSQFPAFAQCQRDSAPQSLQEEQGSKSVAWIAGVVVAVVLVAVILVICLLVFRIKRRRMREKQLDDMNAPNDDPGEEGGALESVCAVVKLPQTITQTGTVEVEEPSSNESLNETLTTSHIQFEVLSLDNNDCITPIGVDESPSAWYTMGAGSSYGNTVLLDAQNPFFPGHATSSTMAP